jgi:hypothetical protein
MESPDPQECVAEATPRARRKKARVSPTGLASADEAIESPGFIHQSVIGADPLPHFRHCPD